MRRRAGAVLVIATALALGACGSSGKKAAVGTPLVPVPVVQHASLPGPVKIGVLYSTAGTGLDWSQAVDGASVAAYRFSMGGAKISLDWQSDNGTAAGANQAVKQFISDGVSGIVVASSGPYLDSSLTEASLAHVPTILAYYSPTSLPEGVWSIAPSDSDIATALSAALSKKFASHPVVLEADGQTVGDLPGVKIVQRIGYSQGTVDAASSTVLGLMSKGSSGLDSVVISGNAASQAAMVARLQQVRFPYSIILTPHALSSNFSQTLAADGGTAAGSLTTVGFNTGDVVALSSDPGSSQLSSFFAAGKLTVGAPGVLDASANAFSVDDEAQMDTRGHDAVVALVRAVAAAKSAAPSSVLTALSKLTLGPSQGLAGPALNFSQSTNAVLNPASVVVPLGSTAQDPGVRDAVGQGWHPLYWFALSDNK